MAFRFEERPGSRRSSFSPPTEVIEYLADGVGSALTVRVLAASLVSPVVDTTQGTLYLQNLELIEIGTMLYYVTATYGQAKGGDGSIPVGSFRRSFDTSGGTFHITVSKATRAKYASSGTAPDHKGAIGVRNGEVEGTDIVIPALKITVSAKHPAATINAEQMKNIARNTGKTNSGAFLGFAAGEVLFLGATGTEGTDCETEVAYQFACSENLSNQIINGITVASKRGWDVLWTAFADDADTDANGEMVVRPKYIYVERVYDEFDMAAFFGF